MKLKLMAMLALSALALGSSASAQVGDAVGSIYTTDIVAYVDDMPIKSYNIGGKTAIVIEELREYGFYVDWRPDERRLVVKTEYKPQTSPAYTHVTDTPGKPVGSIYETDIAVTINGIEIPSFNLGGITAVAIEDIVDLPEGRYSYDQNSHMNMSKPYADTGMYYIWNGSARTINLNTLRPGDKIETDFGELLVGSNGWSVERMDYRLDVTGFSGMDGKHYAIYSTAPEIDGEKYVLLSEAAELFSGSVKPADDVIELSFDTEAAVNMRVQNSFSKPCSNILYPLCAKLSVNGNVSDREKKDFYVYKGQVYVSTDALSKCAGRELFSDFYKLPAECTEELGKILYSKHSLYINGRAVNSFLGENGEYYIPVDAMKDAAFGIEATVNSRAVTTPVALPEDVGNNNYPSNYFMEDYENKGYFCSFYNSPFSVTIDGEEISSVYVYYSDAILTPCIPLGELIEKTGYGVSYGDGIIRVYTREDRMNARCDYDNDEIVFMYGEQPIKAFSIYEYHNYGVFGEYVCLAASMDRYGVTDIFTADTFEKLIELKGHVKNIEDGKILAFENTDLDGEWARKYFVYDMTGALLDTYIDNK